MRRILHEIVTVYCHELLMVVRDGGVLLFLLFLPLIYPIIYSLIYNPEIVRDVEMIVVDENRSSLSRQLIRDLDATPEIKIIGHASNMEEAKHAMHSHQCFAILLIPHKFSTDISRNIQTDAVIFSDMSLLLRYKAFLTASANVAQKLGSDIQFQKSADLGSASPLQTSTDLMPITSVNMGNTAGGLDSFIMPGVLILILHQCIILAIGMIGGAYREQKHQQHSSIRLTISIVGRALCYLTLIFPAIIFLTYYVPIIFSFPMFGNFFETLLFLFPMLLASIFFGFCFQTFVSERESVFMLWVATSIILIFLSGLTWPRYAMPQLWQIIGGLFPSTWAIEGFIKMNSNGAELWQVANEYLMLWILAAGYFILAFLLQRYHKNINNITFY